MYIYKPPYFPHPRSPVRRWSSDKLNAGSACCTSVRTSVVSDGFLCVHIYIYTCTHIYTYLYMYIYIYLYIHMYVYICVYIYRYIHICVGVVHGCCCFLGCLSWFKGHILEFHAQKTVLRWPLDHFRPPHHLIGIGPQLRFDLLEKRGASYRARGLGGKTMGTS